MGRRIAGWREEAKAVGWLFGADVFARIVGQIAVVLTVRRISVAEYGSLSVGLAVFAIVIVVADAGIGAAAVQRLTTEVNGVSLFNTRVQALRIVCGVPFVLIGAVIAIAFSSTLVRMAGVFIACGVLANAITGPAFAGRIARKFSSTALWTSVLLLCQWVGGLAGVLLKPNAFSGAFGIVVFLLSASVAALRSVGRPDQVRDLKASDWLRDGRPFLITAAAVALYSRGDRVVVGALAGASAAGKYSAAYGIVMIAALGGSALQSAVYPRLLREGKAAVLRRCRRRSVAVVILTAPAAGVIAIVSQPLMTALYGEKYSSGANLLRALAPLIVLYVLNPLLSAQLTAIGRQGAVARAAIVNLALACVLYPLLTWQIGGVGTAIASWVIEITGTCILISVLVGQRVSIRPSPYSARHAVRRAQDPSTSASEMKRGIVN